jgi:hypothetical protein
MLPMICLVLAAGSLALAVCERILMSDAASPSDESNGSLARNGRDSDGFVRLGSPVNARFRRERQGGIVFTAATGQILIGPAHRNRGLEQLTLSLAVSELETSRRCVSSLQTDWLPSVQGLDAGLRLQVGLVLQAAAVLVDERQLPIGDVITKNRMSANHPLLQDEHSDIGQYLRFLQGSGVHPSSSAGHPQAKATTEHPQYPAPLHEVAQALGVSSGYVIGWREMYLQRDGRSATKDSLNWYDTCAIAILIELASAPGGARAAAFFAEYLRDKSVRVELDTGYLAIADSATYFERSTSAEALLGRGTRATVLDLAKLAAATRKACSAINGQPRMASTHNSVAENVAEAERLTIQLPEGVIALLNEGRWGALALGDLAGVAG